MPAAPRGHRPPPPPPPPRRAAAAKKRYLGPLIALTTALLILGASAAAAAWLLGARDDRPAETLAPAPQKQLASEAPPRRPIAVTEAPPRKDKEPPPPETKPPDDPLAPLVARINAQRKRDGAAAVTLHPEHSRGCSDHASYLARHLADDPELDLHDQDGRAGATDAGRAAARAASVSRRPPDEALGRWLQAPAHRAWLTDPALKTIGLGLARDAADGWVIVADFTRGRDRPAAGKNDPVIYPADGQGDVPLSFPGNEVPDPLPLTEEKLAGYPLTATFPRGARLPSARAWLEDEDGQDVPVWFSSPARPANEAHASLQQNTLCAFARKPLRPGVRYALKLEASVGGADWSRVVTFTTQPPAEYGRRMYQRAAARLNHHRQAAGLAALELDAALTADCAAHARYVARHLAQGAGRWISDEEPDKEGYTEGGRKVASRSAIRLGGGRGPADSVDWMMPSVINRHTVLSPAATRAAFGAAPNAPAGWVWVVHVPQAAPPRRGPAAYLYPGKDQADVPLWFGWDVRTHVPKAPAGSLGGFPITARFPRGEVTGATAALSDGEGNKVECWVGTPQRPLAATGSFTQIVLLPRAPLRGATTYTVSMSATRDGQPWAEKWSFTTLDPAAYRAAVAKELVRGVNEARRLAGLGAVVLDEGLGKGCQAHAEYVARNIDHPKVRGLGIHDELPELPGYTKEGERAGGRAVIAVISDPADSVAVWLATLYHRIPVLAPELKRVGYGQARHPLRGWVTVMDTGAR